MNSEETTFVKFSPTNVKHKNNSVLLNGETLEPVETTTFLCLTVESNLQWGTSKTPPTTPLKSICLNYITHTFLISLERDISSSSFFTYN